MTTKNYTRRDFIEKTSAGLAGAAAAAGMAPIIPGNETPAAKTSRQKQVFPPSSFAAEVQRLPEEKIYDYHK
ncbi:MAG: twin-arginine translocation signal domain-containing protein, partial [Bacteroidales bacterium]|nr:twin-arginine translocation signal domain-containing protein [Bacteroidales bacterium]